jgi:hypothetical protein
VGNTSVKRRSDGSQSGSVTLRVPSDKFEESLTKARALGKVSEVSSNVEDITAQFVDMEARLKNAQREEQEILKLFDRGGKLSEVIEVETKLASVRQTIEQMQGQMRVWRDQIDLSTLTISFFERGEAAVAESGPFSISYHLVSAWRALVGLLRAIVTMVIYVVIVGWVFWLPVVLLIWLVRRRRRKAAGG